VGQLSLLQQYTLFDVVLQTISQCIDNLEIAAHCVLADDGALLSILSKRLNDAACARDAAMYISLCETLIDLLCNSNVRHAVSAEEPFPPDLVAPLLNYIQTDHLRDFFKHAFCSPHAKRLHGGMVVPGCGDIPSMTLKQLANREEKSSGITVLGYAAATHNCDAVRMLLAVGADPNLCGSNGRNAMDMAIQHNSNKNEMLGMLQSIKEVQTVRSRDASSVDSEACMRITGKSTFEIVAPVWDVLFAGAAATPYPEICFALLSSLFETVSAMNSAILENLFVVAIPAASASRTPRANSTPQAHDPPRSAVEHLSPLSSVGESTSQGCLKLLASGRAESFLKLLAAVAKKFRKIKGVHRFALSALPALLKLLKLPTARPLARLCHRLHLVDPTLSELAVAQEADGNAAVPSPLFAGRAVAAPLPEYVSDGDEEEDDGNGDEGNGDEGNGDEENEDEGNGDEENEDEENGDEEEEDDEDQVCVNLYSIHTF
jgi:hypothetical protein